MPIIKCKLCGKERYEKPNRIKRLKNHYCSRKCFYKNGWDEESKLSFSRARSGNGNYNYGKRGSQTSQWKGDRAKKNAMHIWVVNYKGKPNKCEHCGTTSAKRYHWANKDHSYKRILKDYIRLCVSCHASYDYFNNNCARGFLKRWLNRQ
ncbi:MAG TPA: NUMOD3 domain-containing DNA-binding protein [Patescibacteria group bacterium]|nr:NUMOD3 domain-containing DNA-binding protein [Patescibacteria group bacterium]